MVPQELRPAYRVLKNAGLVPPAVALRKEIHAVEQLLAGLDEGEARDAGLRRVRRLMSRLNMSASANLRTEQHYYETLLRRFAESTQDQTE